MNLFEKLGTQKTSLHYVKIYRSFVKDFSISAAKASNIKDFKTEEKKCCCGFLLRENYFLPQPFTRQNYYLN